MKTKMLATVLVAFSVGCLTTAVLFYRSTAPAPEPEVAVAAPPKTATMAITRQGGSKTAPARRLPPLDPPKEPVKNPGQFKMPDLSVPNLPPTKVVIPKYAIDPPEKTAQLPHLPGFNSPNRLPPVGIDLPKLPAIELTPLQQAPTIQIVDNSFPIAPEPSDTNIKWVKKFDFKEYGQVTVTISYGHKTFKANIFAEIGGGVLDVNLVGENSVSQQGVVYGVITKTEIVDLQLPPHPELLEFSKECNRSSGQG